MFIYLSFTSFFLEKSPINSGSFGKETSKLRHTMGLVKILGVHVYIHVYVHANIYVGAHVHIYIYIHMYVY